MTARDAVAAIIAGHYGVTPTGVSWPHWRCRCGHTLAHNGFAPEAEHSAHVAEMIEQADGIAVAEIADGIADPPAAVIPVHVDACACGGMNGAHEICPVLAQEIRSQFEALRRELTPPTAGASNPFAEPMTDAEADAVERVMGGIRVPDCWDTLDEVPWTVRGGRVVEVHSPRGILVGLRDGYPTFLSGQLVGSRLPLDSHGPWTADRTTSKDAQ
jgi:hypothetical protein